MAENSNIKECAWCGAEITGKPFKNKHGEEFCTASHRSSSNRALKRFIERTSKAA